VNPKCGMTCTNDQCNCGINCQCQLYLISNPKACDGKVSIENGHCKCKWILNMMLAIYMILIDSNCSWKIFVVKTIKWSLIQLNFKIKLSIITSFLLSAIIMASKLLVLSHASRNRSDCGDDWGKISHRISLYSLYLYLRLIIRFHLSAILIASLASSIVNKNDHCLI
jgi:hypothetical protein